MEYSYDDCLTPNYNIPGLIASLLGSANIFGISAGACIFKCI